MLDECQIKIGDKVICIKSCIMDRNGNSVTTVGKVYEIVEKFGILFDIINDEGHIHSFTFRNGGIYFSDIKYIRKKKIERINNSYKIWK